MEIEIDMPEWFDQYVVQPITWGMSTDLIGVQNIWLVAAGLLVLILFMGVAHGRKINRKKKREAANRAYVDNSAPYDEYGEPYDNRFMLPRDVE